VIQQRLGQSNASRFADRNDLRFHNDILTPATNAAKCP
jgi:hypothetical protein